VPDLGEQADVLRALGRWLDQQGAGGVQITNYDTFLSVTWDQQAPGAAPPGAAPPGAAPPDCGGAQAGVPHRAYQEHELATLRVQARRLRQGTLGSPGGTLAELLRTLGQELDQDGLQASGIVQEPAGFRVSGVADRRYFSRFYETSELQEASAQRRSARASTGDQGFGSLAHIIEAWQGLPVYTQDEQRLGTVAEVHGQQLKVRTGLLQRDYWLPISCIGAMVPGERLVLGFLKADLALQKCHGMRA
jgi:hypothetical protein